MSGHEHKPPTREQMDAYQARLLELVLDHGIAVQGVGGTATSASFTYSVGLTLQSLPEVFVQGGLTLQSLPEVFVQGIPTNVAGHVINRVHAQALVRPEVLTPGTVFEGLLEGGYKLTLCETTSDECHQARNLFGPEAVQVHQLVYQDMEHRYPWDDGYSLDPRIQGSSFIPPDRPCAACGVNSLRECHCALIDEENP